MFPRPRPGAESARSCRCRRKDHPPGSAAGCCCCPNPFRYWRYLLLWLRVSGGPVLQRCNAVDLPAADQLPRKSSRLIGLIPGSDYDRGISGVYYAPKEFDMKIVAKDLRPVRSERPTRTLLTRSLDCPLSRYIVLSLLFVLNIFAQTGQGGIVGVVTDTSGAVISGAEV